MFPSPRRRFAASNVVDSGVSEASAKDVSISSAEIRGVELVARCDGTPSCRFHLLGGDSRRRTSRPENGSEEQSSLFPSPRRRFAASNNIRCLKAIKRNAGFHLLGRDSRRRTPRRGRGDHPAGYEVSISSAEIRGVEKLKARLLYLLRVTSFHLLGGDSRRRKACWQMRCKDCSMFPSPRLGGDSRRRIRHFVDSSKVSIVMEFPSPRRRFAASNPVPQQVRPPLPSAPVPLVLGPTPLAMSTWRWEN